MSMKIRDGAGTGAPDGGTVGKWALRQILYKHVPRDLIDRPKAGFAIPIGQWLRGPLRPWAEELLSESRLRAEGYLNPGPVREAWAQHLSGRYDWTVRLWTVLMFQAWVEEERASREAVKDEGADAPQAEGAR
jgi:asparagine synthase (glutamine-hydrolysing)